MKYTLQQLDQLDLFTFLENTAKAMPRQKALAYVGEEYIDYGDFYRQSLQLASFLQAQGVNAYDKIAIWGENGPQWLIAYFAIVSFGAVAVPVLPDFSAKEIENIIQHSEAKILFISDSFKRKLKGLLTGITMISLGDFSLEIWQNGKQKTIQFQNFVKDNPEIKPRKTIVHAEDLASIIYTSGTTGNSKGVMLSHRNLVANGIQGHFTFAINKEDRFLSLLPMSHTLEFTLGNIYPVMYGASIHYLRKPPTATVLLPAMSKIKPTFMLTVPLIIEKIYKSKIRPELTNSVWKKKLFSWSPMRKWMHKIAGKKLMGTFGGEMRFFGIGGAKLDGEVEQFLLDAKFPYAIGYGLTETSPLLAGAIPGKWKLGSTGTPVKGVRFKLINIDPKTGEGEIVAYGPNVMKGYYKAEHLNKQVFVDDGGFRTGDTGIIDKDGYLFIKGRIKNMILGPSGENIFPEEIEEAINKSEWVMESLVYELKGKIIARVELNHDAIQKTIQEWKEKAADIEQEVELILKKIQKSVNEEVNKFSRINKIFEQKEPFIKTPTRKIKRYLYHDLEPHENPVEKKEKIDK
jgi:long-chain acyl-CoA synthetase